MAVMGALEARHRTGRGQFVDVSLFDSLLGVMSYVGSMAFLMGEDIARMGNQSVVLVPMGTYECADGPIMIVVGNDRQYERFCKEVLERPDLFEDPRYADIAGRLKHRDILEPAITDVFRQHDREHWVAKMRAAGVPAGAVRKPSEAIRSAEAEGGNMIHKVAYDGRLIDTVGSPLKLSATPTRAPNSVPRLGEHTEQVLRTRLGLDGTQIDDLRAAGAFGKPP